MIELNKSHHPLVRLAVTAAMVVALIFIGYWLEHHVAAIEGWLQGLGHWAGAGFIALFLVLTPFLFSVDLLCVIAGALFALPAAISYVLIATMLAAALIFVIGRHLAQQQVQLLLDRHPKLAMFNQLIGKGEFKILFLIRLLPLPFALTSYLFSVSRARFLPYWLATCGIFFYNGALTYFGYLAGHMSKQLSQGEAYSGPQMVMLIAGVMVALLVLAMVIHYAKGEIARLQMAEEGGADPMD